jgi:hypothetical protein
MAIQIVPLNKRVNIILEEALKFNGIKFHKFLNKKNKKKIEIILLENRIFKKDLFLIKLKKLLKPLSSKLRLRTFLLKKRNKWIQNIKQHKKRGYQK